MTPSHSALRSAVAAAIKTGCDRTAIHVEWWAKTYPGVTESDVREEWAIALAKVPPGTVELQEEAA
jgi:hypothetical protein